MKSRKLVFWVAACALLFTEAGIAQEAVSKFPSKPITYVCPVPPGTTTDLSTRLMAKELEKIFGQPVVVVNKPGAALTLGTAAVATAKHDGYTIGFTGGPPLFFTPLLQKVPYDPVKDLRMVSQFGAFNVGVAVKKDSPFKSFKDIIDYARKNPQKVSYGTTGTNSITHIAIDSIAKQENVQMSHIPFKGTPAVQTAVLGGHIHFGCGDFGALMDSGTLRLVLLLREEKSAEFPDVPILKHLGYKAPYPMIIGVITGKGVPDPIVRKLDMAIAKAIKEPTFIKGMKDLNLPIVYKSSEESDAYVARIYQYYTKVLGEWGLLKK